MPTVSHKCCYNYFKSPNKFQRKTDLTVLCPSPFYIKQQPDPGILGNIFLCFVFVF